MLYEALLRFNQRVKPGPEHLRMAELSWHTASIGG